jgi:hypothetical protein
MVCIDACGKYFAQIWCVDAGRYIAMAALSVRQLKDWKRQPRHPKVTNFDIALTPIGGAEECCMQVKSKKQKKQAHKLCEPAHFSSNKSALTDLLCIKGG